MQKLTRFWISVIGLGLAALALVKCNVAENGSPTILRLKLDDSLSSDAGRFDSIVVDIYDDKRQLVHPGIFSEAYNKADPGNPARPADDSARLSALQVPNAPSPMVIKITAYSKGESVWEFEITVIDGRRTVKVSDLRPAPNAVVPSNPSPLRLKVNGAPGILGAAVLPPEAPQTVVWTFTAPTDVAVIENGNRIRGLKAGTVTVKAASGAAPDIFGTLEVMVSDDTATVKPLSLSLQMPTPLILAPLSAPVPLVGTVLPDGSDPEILWTSSNPDVARITVDGKVSPIAVGTADITARSKADTSISAVLPVRVAKPIQVDGVAVAPKKLIVFTGGRVEFLSVTVSGTDTSARASLSSSDANTASVAADGGVTGRKAGIAVITATAGVPAKTGICSVEVVTDPPRVIVSADQSIPHGGEAVFRLSVTQDHGTVAGIKADMDGNGSFEIIAKAADTATFRKTYGEAGVVTVGFEVTDSEGNAVVVSRKVTVGKPGVPLVDIFDPSKDTTIRATEYKIRFTVKDTAQGIDASVDSTVNGLVEGANTVRAARRNPGGEGWDEVIIRVDRTGPTKPVFTAWTAAQNPTADSRPVWKWAPIADAARYQVKMDNADTSAGMVDIPAATTQYQPPAALRDGPHTLYLRAVDAIGNISAVAALEVTVKAALPATPVPVATPATPSADRTPSWTWKSGDVARGNGTYKVRLNGDSLPNVTAPSYPPAGLGTDLADGKYVLIVRELDDLGQESAPLAFPEIQIDGTRPAITVTGRTSGAVVPLTTTRSATVQGAIVDNAGGAGLATATWELSGGTTKTAAAIATPGSFSFSTGAMANNGTTTLTLRATDRAGNASVFTVAFEVAVAPPTLVFVSPTPADGFVTSGTVSVHYKENNGITQTEALTIAAPSSGETSTAGTFTKTVTNEGGSATITRTFHRVNAGVRFYKPTGSATANCNSWETACRFTTDLTGQTSGYMWLQAGEYDISNSPFKVRNVKIYGGLRANAKSVTELQSGTETVIISRNQLTQGSLVGTGVDMTRMTFTGSYQAAVFQMEPNALNQFFQCKWTDIAASTPYFGTVFQQAHNLRFTDCTFDNSEGNGPMFVGGEEGPGYYSFTNCTFLSNTTAEGGVHDMEGGMLGWIQYRFYDTTGTPPNISNLFAACGLPGAGACPPR